MRMTDRWIAVVSLLALLLIVAPARADVTVVYQVDITGLDPNVAAMMGGSSQTFTLRSKGDKARLDLGNMMTMIRDGSGDLIQVIEMAKGYRRIPAAQAKQDSAAQQTEMQAEPTGKAREIGGYKCEEFIINSEGTVMHAWVAKDFPNAKLLMETLGQMNQASGGSGDAAKLPGMLIESVSEVAPQNGQGAMTVKMTFKTVSRDDIDAKQFEVPKGYSDITQAMGAMGGMGGAPGAKKK